ncbi:enterobactin synthetase component D [Franconibacter daqui]|uniref:enterobactin synthase subunit EntD n=1 Tax=Franconibacter daqui TaxID=2047724 RepID=UPI00166F3ADE|nr:enterobactin synthase subunit EntD [Franconibacter daqui]GGD09446.1 enterobactin synthetase component D [Franconibacter daqui]
MQTQLRPFTFAGHTLFRVDFDPATLHPADLFWLAHHAQITRFAPRRQAEHLAGRIAAAAALRHAGSDSPAPGIGAHREPLWPQGFCGSITHTAGVAIAVAVKRDSATQGIGIDRETLLDERSAPDIAEGALQAGERLRLHQTSLPYPVAVTLAFSAKESLFKALFPQVKTRFGFECAELLSVTEGRLELRLTQPLGPFGVNERFIVHWLQNQSTLMTLAHY